MREPGGENEPARKAVGEMPGRKRQQRQRHELRQPDQAEIEGAPVNRVHLPADRDRRHLAAQPIASDAAQSKAKSRCCRAGGSECLLELLFVVNDRIRARIVPETLARASAKAWLSPPRR